MPWNAKSTASINEVELLRFPTGLHAVKSVVLDAVNLGVTAPTDGSRFQIPVGTILTESTLRPKMYIKYTGGAVGAIKGVLGHPVDMLANATSSDEPVPMFFHDCVFATEAIVGFTAFTSALINDLKTCLFQ
jgi:hypothetical protein